MSASPQGCGMLVQRYRFAFRHGGNGSLAKISNSRDVKWRKSHLEFMRDGQRWRRKKKSLNLNNVVMEMLTSEWDPSVILEIILTVKSHLS